MTKRDYDWGCYVNSYGRNVYKHKLIHNYFNCCIWLYWIDEINELNHFEKVIADEYHKVDLKTVYEYNELVGKYWTGYTWVSL